MCRIGSSQVAVAIPQTLGKRKQSFSSVCGNILQHCTAHQLHNLLKEFKVASTILSLNQRRNTNLDSSRIYSGTSVYPLH